MQTFEKVIVSTVAVLLTLVCIFYLSFTVATSHFESEAAKIADPIAKQDYLDSVKYFGKSYRDCLETQVGLGLDLKGGMNVVLEVSVPDLLENLGNTKDETFIKAMKAAREEEKKTQGDFIDLFIKNYKEIAPDRSLAAVFATSKLPDVKSNSSDEEVEAMIRTNLEETVADSRNVIANRIDQFGVVQPNIQQLEGGQGRIMVEMPGVKDVNRMRKLLESSANLEFWEVYSSKEIAPVLAQIGQQYDAGDSGEKAEVDTLATDTTKANSMAAIAAKKDGKKKFQEMLQMRSDDYCVVGYANAVDTAAIDSIIFSPAALRQLGADVKLFWGAKPADGVNSKHIYELYCLRGLKPAMEGDVVTDAKDGFDQFKNSPEVSMEMNEEGARAWANLTKKNIGRPVAIVLDNLVYSAPNVNQEITGGRSQITGNFTLQDTKELASTLKSGRMKAPVKIVQSEVVGPSLGAQSIKQGIISFVIAFVLLMIYMVLMYGFIPGMVANTALLLNLFFTMGIMASFQAALTMPGIAGIVLTLGMAVDANVLIYERTKEEMRAGKNVRQALAAGYSNAFSAIFDSNLTSIITGIILAVVGMGPVRGFAITLIIGICCSFFTAVFLTRLVYENRMKRDKWLNLTFTTPLSKNLLQNTHFNFMGMYKKSFTIWAVIALIFIGFFAIRGLSRSIDFTGGRNYVVKLAKPVPVEDVRKALAGTFVYDNGEKQGQEANTQVIAFGEEGNVRVSTNWEIESSDATIDDQAETKLFEALSKAGLVTQKDVEAFKDPDLHEGGSIISSTKVGPSIASDVTNKAIISVIIALIAIFLYILLRFRNVAFSIGSIVALALDTLIVVGFFSALWGILPFSLEVDQTFIGAILTVVGYSINDKVVVFDRIRENMRLYKKRDKRTLFNNSLNQTLARTINTSVSTLIVLLCIFIFGGVSIRSFAFAMILGVIFGTLSSIFIAAPVAYLTMGNKMEEEEKAVDTKAKK
ncbi:MAG: protein translocase subunit SecDF [Prevotella sp.]|nr:protein translocase subunit SecDF [Prevotella sp.]